MAIKILSTEFCPLLWGTHTSLNVIFLNGHKLTILMIGKHFEYLVLGSISFAKDLRKKLMFHVVHIRKENLVLKWQKNLNIKSNMHSYYFGNVYSKLCNSGYKSQNGKDLSFSSSRVNIKFKILTLDLFKSLKMPAFMALIFLAQQW